MWRVDEIDHETRWCASETEAIALKLAIIEGKRQARAVGQRHLPIVGVEAWFDAATYTKEIA